jgi:hypothetical protein
LFDAYLLPANVFAGLAAANVLQNQTLSINRHGLYPVFIKRVCQSLPVNSF